MRVLSLEVENILSIEKAHLSFEDKGLVLVEGWNYDTQRANGAGKTAIFNCLSFALYDKLPRKITASEILRRGCKTGFAKCSVLCGEDVWTVQRSRPKGVEFFKNGNREEITQATFESKIRLSYDQFLLTIYTPQANSREFTRFLSAPDAGKKEFILQLLNLNSFSGVKKLADDKVKQLQASIDLSLNKFNSAKSKIAAYEESLVDEDGLLDEVKSLTDLNNSLEEKVLQYSNVVKPDLSQFTKLEDGIRSKLNEILQAKTKKTMLHDKYRELSSSIHEYDSNNSCTECGSSLDTEEARAAHAEMQNKIKAKLTDIKVQIDSLDEICLKEQSIKDMSSKIRDKKAAQSEEYYNAQMQISQLNSLISSNNTKISNNSSKLANNAKLISKIEELAVECEKHTQNLSRDKKDLELYKTLAQFYSPTGAQAYVLDSIVDTFNEIVQKYVDLMAPNMSYTLNSFKETAKGDVVAKFSETLIKGGKEVSVGSLSGGEEKGLSLCVDFALLEVLETQFGMTLNPIVLDEPFDGLDIAGREIVIELLEQLAQRRQIFVIDHSSEAKAMFSKVIRVELRNDISTINTES
jgi:DNA repair exonuclease SbcCD ATPase subunit